MVPQPGPEPDAGGVESLRRSGRDHEDFPGAAGAGGLCRRGLLQHHVRVRAPDAEGRDARAPRRGSPLPGGEPVDDVEGALVEAKPGVRALEVDGRRQHLVAERERGLDEAGGPRRDHQVTDVALHRTDPAEAAVARPPAEGAAQRLDLDGVAKGRRGTVGLHVGDAAGLDAGVGLGHGHDGRLSLDPRCGEARLAGAVVVHRGAANDRVHLVAVGKRVLQSAQHDHGHAVAEGSPGRLGVEGTRPAVDREHRALLVHVAALHRHGHRGPARQRQVALAATEALDGGADGHERGRARSVDGDGGPGEVELEGRARGDVVLLVRGHGVEGAEGLDERRVGGDVPFEVGVVVLAGEDSDGTGEGAGHVPGPLQCLPGGLEEQPVLRVGDLGLSRPHPEEGRVEEVRAFEDAARPHVGRVAPLVGGHGRVELRLGEEGRPVDAFEQVLPEVVDVGRAGEPARHAHHGHVAAPRSAPSRATVLARGRRPGGRERCRRGERGGGEASEGGLIEEVDERDVDAEVLPYARNHAHREQRGAAELEEAVVATHRLDAEDVGPQRGELRLELARGGHEFLGERRPRRRRRRQGAPVQLAVGSHRQRLEPHERRGHHRFRQRLREVLAELGVAGYLGARTGHQVSDEPLHAGSILAGDHRGGLHGRVGHERGLHLSRLDPEAADLDLLVGAPQVLDGAVGEPPHQVAGAVEPRAGGARDRVGHESLRGEVGAVQVPARQAFASHVELAGLSDSHRLTIGVEDVDGGVADGSADGDGAEAFRQRSRDGVAGREGGALGGPVPVDEADPRQRLERPAHVRHGQGLAAGEKLAEPGESARVLVDHHVEESGGEPHGGDAVTADRLRQATGRRYCLGVDGDAPAVQQRAPDLECRGVEGERSREEKSLLAAKRHVFDRPDQPVHGPVPHQRALGPPGGARRVHHVGEALGRGTAVHRVGRHGGDSVGVGVEKQAGGGRVRKRRGGGRVAHHHRDARILEHPSDALARVGRVERQVGAAGLEDAEQSDDHVGGPAGREPHRDVGTDPALSQRSSELVRSPIEFTVRDDGVASQHGRGVGPAFRQLGEELMDRRLGPMRHGRAIPLHQDLKPLGFRKAPGSAVLSRARHCRPLLGEAGTRSRAVPRFFGRGAGDSSPSPCEKRPPPFGEPCIAFSPGPTAPHPGYTHSASNRMRFQ